MKSFLSSMTKGPRLVGLAAFVAAALGIVVLAVRAEPVPRTFAYQGVLTDEAGRPITGPHSITIRVFSDASSGTALCSESETVTVTNGLFRVVIGDGGCTVDPAWFQRTNPAYLEITVGTTTLAPRAPLLPVASAFQAEHAENAARVIVRYGSEEISVGGVYCGSTAEMTGAVGGYAGAKSLCEAACGNPAAHMCSAEEVGRSLQLGMAVPTRQRYLSVLEVAYSSDCSGWWEATTGTSAPGLSFPGSGDPSHVYPDGLGCSDSRRNLCCL